MDFQVHQHHLQYDNLWLSAAYLPSPTPLFVAPWETRHSQELDLRDALCSTYFNTKHSAAGDYSSHTAVDSQDLNPDDPCYRESPFELTSIREANLVSQCLYALQGIPVAVKELQKLAKLFSCQVADRSSHRLPSLWKRSSSTNALGKLLFEIVQAGWIRCQLEKFVEFFLNSKSGGALINQLQCDYQVEGAFSNSRQGKKRKKKKNKCRQGVNIKSEEDLSVSPPYSLVNQAFTKAVKSILQGHLAALNTLTESVSHRRSGDGSHAWAAACCDDSAGAVVGHPVCDMTLLELHLHTQVLRIQLQALASICLRKKTMEETHESREQDKNKEETENKNAEDFDISSDGLTIDFGSFPRGAALLTLLYRQLQEADNIHAELLRYLFSCACQPYLVFVHSWLYRATLKDPYNEFVVHEVNAGSGSQVKISGPIPCFLEDAHTALVRSGQQLKVLLRLVEVGASHYAKSSPTYSLNGFRIVERALKAWTEIANESSVFFPFLIFNKQMLEEVEEERKQKRHNLMNEFNILFSDNPSQTGRSAFRPESRILVPGSLNVSLNKDVAVAIWGHFVDQNAPKSSSSPILHGNTGDMVSKEHSSILFEAMPDDLSDTVPPKRSLDKKEAKQQQVNSMDVVSSTPFVELERPLSREAGGQSSSLKNSRERNRRKRWIEPGEVIIFHGQSDEDSSREQHPAGRSSTFCETLDLELDAGSLDERLAQDEGGELVFSDLVKPFSYKLPALTGRNPLSQVNGKHQDMTSSKNVGLNSFIFFSNFCLEDIGPEIFARSYMRKVAQHYKHISMPQSDGYKKNAANFDAISAKFWTFEDCVCDGSLSVKVLPALLFTQSLGKVETLSLENRSVHVPCSKYLSEGGQAQTDVEHVLCHSPMSKRLAKSTLNGRMAGVSPELRAETQSGRFEEWRRAESLQNIPQESQHIVCQGGATWQSYLENRDCEAIETISKSRPYRESIEVPLEVIVGKCIIQEVLSQYRCISHFTVRLLHEVFDLHGHLAALRRYFFMERGDWAEIFTSALYRNVWHPSGHLQRQLQVQMLLEAAVQNSSCQEDIYAEWLHVNGERENFLSKTYDCGQTDSTKASLCAFQSITLGYRLEWPVNLIITSESLKLYNSIFHFLVYVKLAVHAINDIWRFSKALMRTWRKHGMLRKEDSFNTLMIFRQQVNHFFATLQGHLETHLLHNVWQSFNGAIHQEGKDLVDLERIHGLYLQDALHVCFLSEETKRVKTPIDNIIQCLLDLSTCLNLFGKQQNGKATLDSGRVQSMILEAKNCFDLSIRELLHIELHGQNQSVLSHFWTRLDFNGFFGTMSSKHS